MSLGLGGAGLAAVTSTLDQYRPHLLVLTVLLLTFSHYVAWKQPVKRVSNQIILWTTTVVTAAILAYSFYIRGGIL